MRSPDLGHATGIGLWLSLLAAGERWGGRSVPRATILRHAAGELSIVRCRRPWLPWVSRLHPRAMTGWR
jgi:hypothetical protein